MQIWLSISTLWCKTTCAHDAYWCTQNSISTSWILINASPNDEYLHLCIMITSFHLCKPLRHEYPCIQNSTLPCYDHKWFHVCKIHHEYSCIQNSTSLHHEYLCAYKNFTSWICESCRTLHHSWNDALQNWNSWISIYEYFKRVKEYFKTFQ